MCKRVVGVVMGGVKTFFCMAGFFAFAMWSTFGDACDVTVLTRLKAGPTGGSVSALCPLVATPAHCKHYLH